MKWIFAIKERYKLAVYLMIIFVIILAANLFERSQVEDADQTLISMYNDRIIPAKDISSVLGYMYKNQLSLQEHMRASGSRQYQPIEQNIRTNNQLINSLMEKFARTYLVDKEVTALNQYKEKIKAYRKLEEGVIALSKSGRKTEAYEHYRQGQPAFLAVIEPIHQLAAIQASVGEELYKNSHQKLASARMVSSFEIAIAIVIGLLIHVLLKASLLINRMPQKPSLN